MTTSGEYLARRAAEPSCTPAGELEQLLGTLRRAQR